jgi:hypothetical protein
LSTGLNCQIIEPTPGRWYYVLEDSGAPNNAWDWRENATATGPFATAEACKTYLGDHEANPGGWSVTSHAEFKRSEVYDSLLAPGKVRSPRTPMRWSR